MQENGPQAVVCPILVLLPTIFAGVKQIANKVTVAWDTLKIFLLQSPTQQSSPRLVKRLAAKTFFFFTVVMKSLMTVTTSS